MSWLLAFFVVFYTVFVLAAIIAWRRLPLVQLPENYKPQTRLSILIAVRNEAANIGNLLRDMEKQNYPQALFEILLINDYSEDATAEIIQSFIEKSALNIRLLSLENGRGKGKKSAVAYGLAQANGDLIVQTDGDCRVQPDWLVLLEYEYVSKKAKFISGPVCLTAEKSVFQRMQVVEFASLIGTGAASIALGQPNMCNGANLAYEKAAFYEVKGFAGNEGLASGDDEFLLHKIQNKYPGSVTFLKSPAAIVFTPACSALPDFIAQRVRWASKWRFYQNPAAQVLALLIFGVNLMLFVAAAFWLFGNFPAKIFLTASLVKCGAEIVFLGLILRFLRSGKFLFYALLVQLVYIPYVLYCALAGLAGNYRWKGRNLINP